MEPISGTRPIATSCRNCSASCMPSAVRGIRRSSQKRLCNCAVRHGVPMDIKDVVKEKYGQAALRATEGGSSCCGASAALDGRCDPITANLYDPAQAGS